MNDESKRHKAVPDVPIDDPDGGDDDAARELAGFIDADLEQEARTLQHRRREELRGNLHAGAVVLIWISIGILALMVLFWAYHLLAPDNIHFLSPEQYNELKSVLFSAALSAFVSGYAKKIL